MLLLLALRFAVFISSPLLLLLLLMADDAPTVPLGIVATVVSSPSISKYGDFLLVVADNDLVDLARAEDFIILILQPNNILRQG